MAPKQYTEDDITDAMLAITDERLSQNQAFQRYSIPRTILISRIRGSEAQGNQIQPNQRFTNNNEIKIKDLILRQKSLGYGLSHSQIRAGVEALLKQRGDNTLLEVNWILRFINKYPELKTKNGRIQEIIRFEAFAPKAISWYLLI
jgi:hypothetical protein